MIIYVKSLVIGAYFVMVLCIDDPDVYSSPLVSRPKKLKCSHVQRLDFFGPKVFDEIVVGYPRFGFCL